MSIKGLSFVSTVFWEISLVLKFKLGSQSLKHSWFKNQLLCRHSKCIFLLTQRCDRIWCRKWYKSRVTMPKLTFGRNFPSKLMHNSIKSRCQRGNSTSDLNSVSNSITISYRRSDGFGGVDIRFIEDNGLHPLPLVLKLTSV